MRCSRLRKVGHFNLQSTHLEEGVEIRIASQIRRRHTNPVKNNEKEERVATPTGFEPVLPG